jgi:hypothetical protein
MQDSGQDRVRANRQPDDVWSARCDLGTIGEDRPAVGRPGHLEAARQTGDGLHPESCSEPPTGEIGYEPLDSSSERGSLLGAEPFVFASKPISDFVGRQRLLLQRGEELVVTAEFASVPGFQVSERLS